MSVMQIKHRETGAVLYETEASSLRQLVESAVASGANLSGAYLACAYLSGAYLSDAYLACANLFLASLSRADLTGADLCGVDLTGADLTGSNLSGVNLSGVNLSGAHLGGVAGIVFAASGWFEDYAWSLIQQAPGGPILLRYGCEVHQLEAWTDKLIDALCAKHRPHDTELPGQLRVLVKICKEVQP